MAIFDFENKFERVDYVLRSLSFLAPSERAVLALHYGLTHSEWSLQDISRSTGLSRGQLHRLKTDALRKISQARRDGLLGERWENPLSEFC